MRQSVRNIQLQMECRAILTYLNVVGTLFNRLDVTNERACMVTKKEEEHTDLLETMIKHNDQSKSPLSKNILQQAINTIVAETEDEKSYVNNVNTYTFIQPPVTNNAPREK